MLSQHQALDILKLGRNVYLTGPAGAGKTHLLNTYIDLIGNPAAVAITASTGIAATHIGGMTIHSWSGIGIKDQLRPADLKNLAKKSYLKKRFKKARVLIIDEISMLHHYRLDMIDQVCQYFKQDARPFGGLQVIFSGDFFQLPPVTKRSKPQSRTPSPESQSTLYDLPSTISGEAPAEPETEFAFESNVWQNMNLKVCYLEDNYRQTDNAMLALLNEIRTDNVSETTMEYLKSRYQQDITGLPDHITPTKLYTHNADVDAINNRELTKLPGKTYTYKMSGKGHPHLVSTLTSNCLAPEHLQLKQGARVMFVKNNFELGYVNGTLGTVVAFDAAGQPIVETAAGERITPPTTNWSIEEDGKILAEVYQLPLRLAWAITVHKSQGMSLDAVEVDLSRSFEPGMGYVALSRVRTLNGLKLMGINNLALKVHPQILEFDQELKRQSSKLAAKLDNLDKSKLKPAQSRHLDILQATEPDKPSTYDQTLALVQDKRPLELIAKKRDLTPETIVNHLKRLVADGKLSKSEIKHLNPFTSKQLAEIKKAFAKNGGSEAKLAPTRTALKNKYSFLELNLAHLFIYN